MLPFHAIDCFNCSFFFAGNEESLFTIDPSLGIISLVSNPLEWSAYSTLIKEHFLLVRATDHAPEPRSASVSVRITVTLPTDAPPVWNSNSAHQQESVFGKSKLDFGEGVTQAKQVVEVGEWTHRGTAVAVATASNPKTSLHYSITGGNSAGGEDTEEGMFAITPASGVISLASLLDREKCDWYNLTISASNAVSVVKEMLYSRHLRVNLIPCKALYRKDPNLH